MVNCNKKSENITDLNNFNDKDNYKLNKTLKILIKQMNKINLHLSHIDYDVKKIKESVGIKNEKNN